MKIHIFSDGVCGFTKRTVRKRGWKIWRISHRLTQWKTFGLSSIIFPLLAACQPVVTIASSSMVLSPCGKTSITKTVVAGALLLTSRSALLYWIIIGRRSLCWWSARDSVILRTKWTEPLSTSVTRAIVCLCGLVTMVIMTRLWRLVGHWRPS